MKKSTKIILSSITGLATLNICKYIISENKTKKKDKKNDTVFIEKFLSEMQDYEEKLYDKDQKIEQICSIERRNDNTWRMIRKTVNEIGEKDESPITTEISIISDVKETDVLRVVQNFLTNGTATNTIICHDESLEKSLKDQDEYIFIRLKNGKSYFAKDIPYLYNTWSNKRGKTNNGIK